MYQWPEEIPREEYTRLYFLEKMLRWLIKNQLSKITEKWWNERIPEDIKVEAEERGATNRQYEGASMDLDPIWFIQFRDYKKILLRNDNWEQAFRPIFKSKKYVNGWLHKLAPLRNKIAHMRPLNPRERMDLEELSQDILVLIWEGAYNLPYITPSMEFLKQSKYQQAEELLLQGFKETEKDPWIAYNLGELYESMDKLSEAEKWFYYAEKYLVLPRYKDKAIDKLKKIKEKIRRNTIVVCPQCGHEMPKAFSFCGSCGKNFKFKLK